MSLSRARARPRARRPHSHTERCVWRDTTVHTGHVSSSRFLSMYAHSHNMFTVRLRITIHTSYMHMHKYGLRPTPVTRRAHPVAAEVGVGRWTFRSGSVQVRSDGEHHVRELEHTCVQRVSMARGEPTAGSRMSCQVWGGGREAHRAESSAPDRRYSSGSRR